LRYNQSIVNNFQDIFNLLPNLKLEEMVQSLSVKSNDYMYVIYVSNLIRVTLSLHDLINNKIRMKDIEADNLTREKEAEDEHQKKKEEIAKLKVEAALKKSKDAEAADKSK
jgi:26S proteasome regulatory subunit N8